MQNFMMTALRLVISRTSWDNTRLEAALRLFTVRLFACFAGCVFMSRSASLDKASSIPIKTLKVKPEGNFEGNAT